MDHYSINKFGEFADRAVEEAYQQDTWEKDNHYVRASYLICCILLLFAGIFSDYRRYYFFGSANIITGLRVGLVAYGLYFYFIWKNKQYSLNTEIHLLMLKVYSVAIIACLTLMVQGESQTLLAGIMIMTTSFYVMLPGELKGTILSSSLLLIIFISVPFMASVEPSFYSYKTFMLFSLNIVLVFFKTMFNRASRYNYLSKKHLEEMNNAKDEVISTIAHDLKGPLQVIMSSAQHVSHRGEELSPERIINYQKRILKSVKKTDNLLRELLAWAITSNESLGYNPKCSNIKDTIENAIEFANELAETKNIKINIYIQDCILDHDQNMVETCVRNIISNAIKFSPSGKNINICGTIDNGYEIEVTDEGEGVPDIVLSAIKKGHNSMSINGTHGEKGSGIGLKLVQSFLQKHDADLVIENLPTRGSRVVLKFPLPDEARLEPQLIN